MFSHSRNNGTKFSRKIVRVDDNCTHKEQAISIDTAQLLDFSFLQQTTRKFLVLLSFLYSLNLYGPSLIVVLKISREMCILIY